MAKILVIRGGAIGDFILTLPVLAALRANFPAVELEVLGYPHIARLSLLGGTANAVRSIEAGTLAPFFARHGNLSDTMVNYFAEFAMIVSFLYDPDEIFKENIARCTKAQFIQGPHRPDDQAGRHATDVFLQSLERLAIFDADPVPRIRVAASAPSGASVANWVAFHPGSGSERKNWPETKWSHLLEQLRTEGRLANTGLLLVGGEAEGDRLARLAGRIPSGCSVELASNRPLTELAARLAACRFFLGHDSGITHLAAAVGLPGLALWGDTPEEVWKPRSDRMEVLLRGKRLAELGVDDVLDALRRRAAFDSNP